MKQLLFLILLFTSQPVWATGIPVIDVANLAEAITQVYHLYQSNLNEVTQIENQMEQIYQGELNLESLTSDIIESYGEQMEGLFEEVGEIHGLMQDLSVLYEQYEEIYPDFASSAALVTGERYSETMKRTLEESRKNMIGASRTGAKVLENLKRSKSDIDQMVVESQSAVGNLQAMQAGNQLVASVANQLVQMNAQLATMHQAQLGHLQKQNTSEEYRVNRNEHFFGDFESAEGAVALSPY